MRSITMLRGLWHLTWLEIKIFLREPLGAVGTIVVPVLAFVVLGRFASGRNAAQELAPGGMIRAGVPALVAMVIAVSAVLSLVTVISIYREGGILKRLRATPLRPQTILTAHVLVKLLLTAVTMALMMLAGKRYYAIGAVVPVIGFGVAVLLTTWSIMSIGFVIASIVPTARFAQPVGAIILYPMLAFSGLFFPLDALPTGLRAATRANPLTYAVSLLQGIWQGDAWSAHLGDVAALVVVFAICTALSARVFKWE